MEDLRPMVERKCLVILFILIIASPILAEIKTETLVPLTEGEWLAYRMVGENQKTLQLYAQEIEHPENMRLIGEWNSVNERADGVQFTNDRKKCFFLAVHPTYYTQGSLFEYDGYTGEVKYILEMSYPYCISRNGKYLIFNLLSLYTVHHDIGFWQGKFIIAVLEIDTKEVLATFDWTVKKNWGGAFRFAMDKNDNIIHAYHILEGGYFPAHAIIDLDTLEFDVLRDITDEIAWSETNVPEITADEYKYDDRINKHKDETLRLP
jgi:hypothetical protein